MSWARNLTSPIVLASGATLKTLGDARDLILANMRWQRHRDEHWEQALELVARAARDSATEVDVARASRRLTDALKAQGLVID
jgi:hypothetical protein